MSGRIMPIPVAAPRPGLDLRHHYGHHQSPAMLAGGLVFCSGMIPVDPDTGEREQGTVTSETRRIFGNLGLVLEAAGSALDRLVQVHALIHDSIEYDVLNRAYRPFIPAPPPARTVWTAQSEAGFKVQLDVVAALGTMPGLAAPPPLETAVAFPSAQTGHGAGAGMLASPMVRAGPFLIVSGLSATDPRSGQPVRTTTVGETRVILDNLRQMLEDAGSSMARVVKVTVLLRSMLEAMPMNGAYARFFPDPPPARTVCGAMLPDGAKVAIECTALA